MLIMLAALLFSGAAWIEGHGAEPQISAFQRSLHSIGQSVFYRNGPGTKHDELPAKPAEADPSSVLNAPCVDGSIDRRSDLCAQWASADAAKRSADYAGSQIVPSWFGVLLSGLGTIGLVISLLLTLRALRISKISAEAATDQARTSSNASYHQLRAYLGILRPIPPAVTPETKAIQVVVKNFGQTPANDARFTWYCSPFEGQIVSIPIPKEMAGGPFTLLPGQEQNIVMLVRDWPHWRTHILSGAVKLLFHCQVTYEDYDLQRQTLRYFIVIDRGEIRWPTVEETPTEDNLDWDLVRARRGSIRTALKPP